MPAGQSAQQWHCPVGTGTLTLSCQLPAPTLIPADISACLLPPTFPQPSYTSRDTLGRGRLNCSLSRDRVFSIYLPTFANSHARGATISFLPAQATAWVPQASHRPQCPAQERVKHPSNTGNEDSLWNADHGPPQVLSTGRESQGVSPDIPGSCLTLDLVNDPPEPALNLMALQPILPPNEEEVEQQQQEERGGVDQLHPMAGVGMQGIECHSRGQRPSAQPVPGPKPPFHPVPSEECLIWFLTQEMEGLTQQPT